MRHRTERTGKTEGTAGEGVEGMVLECWEQGNQMDSGQSLPLNLRGVYQMRPQSHSSSGAMTFSLLYPDRHLYNKHNAIRDPFLGTVQ